MLKKIMGESNIEISPLKTKKDFKEFIRLPWRIYHYDKFWVPPLISMMKQTLNKRKHPFFLHSDAEFFVARLNGQVVGRIAAIENRKHNEYYNDHVGFFGFYECIRDVNVSNALFDSAAEWLRARGLTSMRGPENYSQNDSYGFLAEGFASSPVVMTTYNPQYFLDFAEQYGFLKVKDLYAYYMDKGTPLPQKLIHVTDAIRKKTGIVVRPLDTKQFEKELEWIKTIYNSAWSDNWGFVPMTDEEFDYIVKLLRPIVKTKMVFIGEVDGEPAAFSLTIPDINPILKNVNGRLFPFGYLRFLWERRRINGARIVTLGVIKQYQRRGIDAVLYLDTYRQCIAHGIGWGEFSWISEDNVMMNRSAKMLGARIYKVYRLYEKDI